MSLQATFSGGREIGLPRHVRAGILGNGPLRSRAALDHMGYATRVEFVNSHIGSSE